MIGQPLHTGTVSEVCPVAPRPEVKAPLVMERLLQFARTPEMLTEAQLRGELAASLGPSWQRLVSADFGTFDGQYIYERFVGLTLRDVSLSLRNTNRVLPMDVLRRVSEITLDGLEALEGRNVDPNRPIHLSDRSVGLGLDRRWRFAIGALNHWLADVRVPLEENSEPLSPDVMFFLSPEAFQAREETSASVATRGGLFVHQLTTGGFHPYRGNQFQIFPSVTRYTRSEIRVPVTVHPEMTPLLERALVKGVNFAGERFGSIAELKAELSRHWPKPAASDERTFSTLISVCWGSLQRQLHALRREPLLPIFWENVWSASRTPEEGLAVLEDQFLEALVPTHELPARFAFEEQPDEVAEPVAPAQVPPTDAPRVTINVAPRRVGLLARLLSIFGRTS